MGRVIQFRAGDQVPSGAAAQLSTRDKQQQTVQPRQCLLTGPSRAAQRRQPPRRLTIRAVNQQHPCRYYDPALAPSRAQRACTWHNPPSIQAVRGAQNGIFCRVVILANAP